MSTQDPLSTFLLDEPFLRVPLECANTSIRSGYKTLEIDMLRLTSYAARHMGKSLAGQDVDTQEPDTSNNPLLSPSLSDDLALYVDRSTVAGPCQQATIQKRIQRLRPLYESLTRMVEFVKKIEKKTTVYRDDVEKYISRTLKRLELIKNESIWPGLQTIATLATMNPQGQSGWHPGQHPLPVASSVFPRILHRLDAYIFDYCVRVGLIRTATELKALADLDDLVDDDLFLSAQKIIHALHQKDIEPALSWCSTHRTKLKKLKNSLETNLRLQATLSLIEQGRADEGMVYIRKHFTANDILIFPDLKHVLCLLAFLGPQPFAKEQLCMDNLPEKYRSLFDKSRWILCAQLFETAMSEVYGLPKNSTLVLLIQCGAAVLKSRACQESVSPSCPTCNPFWKHWLSSIITTHHVLSFIVCPVKGHVMNDTDPPLASPDGLVFSTSAVAELRNNSTDGKIECPCTGNRYSIERFHRLYIS